MSDRQTAARECKAACVSLPPPPPCPPSLSAPCLPASLKAENHHYPLCVVVCASAVYGHISAMRRMFTTARYLGRACANRPIREMLVTTTAIMSAKSAPTAILRMVIGAPAARRAFKNGTVKCAGKAAQRGFSSNVRVARAAASRQAPRRLRWSPGRDFQQSALVALLYRANTLQLLQQQGLIW